MPAALVAFTYTVVSWARQQIFAISVLTAVALALVWPHAAESKYAGLAAELAVALIFFLQGLSLAMSKMLSGARPLRLHIFVLGWNFVLLPALAALLIAPFSLLLGSELRVGIWMLAILPTTIASATALAAASGGAVPQAIFASIFSNLLAVVLVPMLALAYFSTAAGVEMQFMLVWSKLFWIVVLPLLLGRGFRRAFRGGSVNLSRRVKWLPRAAIILIVYLSFSESVKAGFIDALPLAQFIYVLAAIVLLLFFASVAVWFSSGWLGIRRDERVSAFFTASQKSIATGLPLLTTTFAAMSVPLDRGLILVPLLIYHSLQLLVGAILVPKLGLYVSKEAS
ncbi:MAG: bile acid:sodium symporter [Opitutales bacterium]